MPKQSELTVAITLSTPKIPGTDLELATTVLTSFVTIMERIAGPNAGVTEQPRITAYSHGAFTITLPEHQVAAATTLALAMAATDSDDGTFARNLDLLETEAIDLTLQMLTKTSAAEVTFGLSTPEAQYNFTSIDQAWAATHKFSPDNISESERQIEGYFAGYLPTPRRAEFYRTKAKDTIYANVAKQIADAAQIHSIIGKQCLTLLNARTVGDAPTRYLIKEFTAQDSLSE